MVRILSVASLGLAVVSAVAGHVIRHRFPPKGWETAILEVNPPAGRLCRAIFLSICCSLTMYTTPGTLNSNATKSTIPLISINAAILSW